ncbi:MazF family transcriptional regulator [Photorhabdus noenieputensis]|uniref:MazF family transcriptional regulator n=2 Tax=Enterobacterales TaxID=91347 RepID=A0A0A0CSK3_9GAMM|nr:MULTISPECIES: type II toxin-antitoxin system PemK/MazF family toxin [Photorhabdus]KGM29371.1 MazF family transcriptional regulator [Photorhabdus luminescens]MBS9427825.1 MazF family transcriptional regulator [Photorhabdus akhurstii]MBS9437433.1 MazF family transcriptional regulator [Photorhabdus noenieputensis]MCK3670009.1 type II toxin-antitoxin system PemK/MazF family toxin [Photorhabdus noenieputensis]PQQ25882.1 MazF family transcriptional regulator [Photorhabdus hindustanensis]
MFVPKRGDICWLDFEPTKGKEIGKYRPTLILSHETYNRLTGLVICCPISTSIRGAPTEVPVTNLEQPCIVATTLIQTLDWRQRKVKFITASEPGLHDEVLLKLIPLIGGEHLLSCLPYE